MLHHKIQEGSWTPIYSFKVEINWKKEKEINKYISFLDARLDSTNHGYTLLLLALL